MLRLRNFRSISYTKRLMTNYIGSPYHKDTPDNNSDTFFDFTEENYARIHEIVSRYPINYKRAAVIPVLDLAQRQNNGWLTLNAMRKVARILEMDYVPVYEIACFYSMFNRQPVGRYFLQVCGTTPCMVCGSEEIIETIKGHLNLDEGDVTADGMFGLREVECLGSCVNAPMMQINDDYYECLTPKDAIDLIEECKQGKLRKVGVWGSLPMNGQLSCEGPLGKTSLLSDAPPPGFKCREDFKPQVDPAKIKKEMAYDKY